MAGEHPEEGSESPGWGQDGELIASLLARPDEDALAVLMQLLPQSIAATGLSAPNTVRDCIAPAALSAFPDALLAKYISAQRREELRLSSGFCR